MLPGYISSKDGPQMDASWLEDICKNIQKTSGISEAYDYGSTANSPIKIFSLALSEASFRNQELGKNMPLSWRILPTPLVWLSWSLEHISQVTFLA